MPRDSGRGVGVERCAQVTEFVFLQGDGESNGERVARCAEQSCSDGPMGAYLDPERYMAFLHVWGREDLLRFVKTSCAVYAGAVLGWSGKELKKPWKSDGSFGIFTWLGLSFQHPSWCWAEDGVPDEGSIVYRDYNRKTTGMGHVQILTRRHEDGLWTVCEGGGGLRQGEGSGLSDGQRKATSGTVCRMSAPKDFRAKDSLGRLPIGWWRPDLIDLGGPPSDPGDTEVIGPSAPFVTLRAGDRGPRVGELQLRLLRLGYRELGSVDSSFGPKTRAATQRFQSEHQLEPDGVVGRRTWAAIEHSTEPAGFPAVNGNGQ